VVLGRGMLSQICETYNIIYHPMQFFKFNINIFQDRPAEVLQPLIVGYLKFIEIVSHIIMYSIHERTLIPPIPLTLHLFRS